MVLYMKVSDYLREWLRGKAPDLRRSTYEAYTIYIEKQIGPYFDELGRDLEELRPLDVHGYVVAKRTGGRRDGKPGGLAAISVRKHLNILKQAFREAVLLEIIPASPAEPVRLPRIQERTEPARAVTTENARAILAALQGTTLYPVVLVTLYYGLRRSEVLGLRWSAVDFTENTLTVRHTVVKNLTIQAGDQTKTLTSRRTFPLLPEVAAALAALPRPSEDGYLFTRADGSPLRPDCLTRSFQRALRRAGIPRMRFHDLRHATATILFDRGWSVPDVQHWLGHADIDTTMNIYVAYSRTRPLALGGTLCGLFADSPEKKRGR